ncbi:MAG: hypothetical protein RL318_2056 [Fibrobacterota bacterium]|jgi:TolB-like protein
MVLRCFPLWLLVAALVCSPKVAAETLAIPDFENLSGKGELQFLGRTLSDALSQPLVERHKFVLVERQRVAEVFKERSLALAGAMGDSAAQAPLQLLAADDLVLGSFEGNSSALKVNVRAVRISDAQVLGALTFEGNLERVLGDMNAAADQIEGILHGRAFGFLDLESDPAGLEVRIDGTRAGKTPLRTVRLLAGAHVIEIVSAGNVLWQDSLLTEPGKTALRRAEVKDPALRQGVSLAVGTGLVIPWTAVHEFENAMDLQALLQVRRGSLSFGLRGFMSLETEQTNPFKVPYGASQEVRTFRVAGTCATVLWHAPQLGPFELGLGVEGGHLWSWDGHPKWRKDLASRIVRQNDFVAGPLVELAWVSGNSFEVFLMGSLPVTLTDWQRDRIVRQDLFPITGSGASNLVLEQETEPLMLPSLDIAVRVHL